MTTPTVPLTRRLTIMMMAFCFTFSSRMSTALWQMPSDEMTNDRKVKRASGVSSGCL